MKCIVLEVPKCLFKYGSVEERFHLQFNIFLFGPQHNIFRKHHLLISCLYTCSTYKIDGICNILSLRALLVELLSAFNASHRVHTDLTITDFTWVFPKVTAASHYLPETRIFPLFTFRHILSIAALQMLKHSTDSSSEESLQKIMTRPYGCP